MGWDIAARRGSYTRSAGLRQAPSDRRPCAAARQRATVAAMKTLREKLGGTGAVKGTMLQAHLHWAEGKLGGARARLLEHVPAECTEQLTRTLLATDWTPFRCLVAIDRAIAKLAGGNADAIYRELGRHSASQNLGGAYKAFA